MKAIDGGSMAYVSFEPQALAAFGNAMIPNAASACGSNLEVTFDLFRNWLLAEFSKSYTAQRAVQPFRFLSPSALQGGFIGFAGANSNDALDIGYEDFPIADPACLGRFDYRFDNCIQFVIFADDFDLDFRDKVDGIF